MAPKAEISLLFLFHLFIHIAAYILPFIISWKIILAITLILYLQLIFVGKCVLTIAQHGKEHNISYLYPYYVKLGLKPNNEYMLFYGNYIEPAVFFILAAVWQIFLGFSPLISLSALF
ncbi:MAG TPA: hypothetical protein VHA12_03245 [Candidatus Nanoarchaeia archaeon]|nr:hypothetical protein [Candidatus Nanoarchaeia archaeon]